MRREQDRDEQAINRLRAIGYCVEPQATVDEWARELEELRAKVEKASRYKHHIVRFEVLIGGSWDEGSTEPAPRAAARRMAKLLRGDTDYRNVRVLRVYRKAER